MGRAAKRQINASSPNPRSPRFDAPALLQAIMVRGPGGRAIFRVRLDRLAFSVGFLPSAG